MKLRFLAGAALGYVLGTKAGRQRYEQIAGSLRELTDSEFARQIKGEVTKLTGGQSAAANTTPAPPVIVGPGPDGKTGTKDTDVVLPDLESSGAASISGDTPAAAGTKASNAKKVEPPAGA